MPITFKIKGGENKKMSNVKYIVAAILILSLCCVCVYANTNRYNITPCDAIDISLGDIRVTTFLDSTNMATVDVYNCKNYLGYNTWLVNWHTET